MFPYLDLAGFRVRTAMPGADVDALEKTNPGYLVRQIALASSYVNARLRKRYGNTGQSNALPLGMSPPVVLGAGTSPPGVALNGRPALGCILFRAQIDTPGVLGVATFRWSTDDGATWQATGVPTAPAVPLAGTGMTLLMPAGTYGVDVVYAAAPPVPEAVLGWITAMVTVTAYDKRGRNPQDPAIVSALALRDRALEELKEAADSKDGLFDLPASEDTDSAVTTGGPLGYTETSPYVWADQQRHVGRIEDRQGRGSS